MSRFVINSVTLCNNFLSHFVIIISKFVKPLYLSHFVINIFKKPKKSIRSFLVTLCHKNYFCKEFRQYPFFSFQSSQERRETLQIVDAIVTWLFENFESLGKKLISKSFFHDLWHVSRQRFTLLHGPNLFLVRKFEWKTAVFREPINTEFHIWAFFYSFGANLIKKNKIVCLRSN